MPLNYYSLAWMWERGEQFLFSFFRWVWRKFRWVWLNSSSVLSLINCAYLTLLRLLWATLLSHTKTLRWHEVGREVTHRMCSSGAWVSFPSWWQGINLNNNIQMSKRGCTSLFICVRREESFPSEQLPSQLTLVLLSETPSQADFWASD